MVKRGEAMAKDSLAWRSNGTAECRIAAFSSGDATPHEACHCKGTVQFCEA